MNRLNITLRRLQDKSRTALIPFITAGHPHPVLTVNAMNALVENGADIIELGMPFSDPMADGEVIQQSSEQAISMGMNLELVIDSVAEFRESNQHTPVVLMGYLNPIEKYGYKAFVSDAAQAGVDALLIVDSPPEESEDLQKHLDKYSMSQIFLVAPTTSETRLNNIVSKASGFIYCVALKGVTGAAKPNYNDLFEQIELIKSKTGLPVAVGFGVKDADSAVEISKHADAVVIGSALVEKLNHCNHKKHINEAVQAFLKPIREALDQNY